MALAIESGSVDGSPYCSSCLASSTAPSWTYELVALLYYSTLLKTTETHSKTIGGLICSEFSSGGRKSYFYCSICNYVFPLRIFDLVKNDHNNKEWMDTTCNHTLYAMTDVFNEFFPKLASLLLRDLLSQFEWCVLQDNDQLARSAASCLENLVLTNRPKMDLDTEHLILKFLAELITNTLMPNTIAKTTKPLVPASTSTKSLKHRVQVHLEIIASVKRMIFGVSMKNSRSNCSLVANDCFQVIHV